MSGTLGFENTPIVIDHGVQSIDGKAVKTDQTTLVNANERDSAGMVTPSDANKQSEINAGFLAWAKAQAAQHGTTLGAFLSELKKIGTYTRASEGAISRSWIKSDTVVSVDFFNANSPYATNDLATLGTASTLSVNPLNNHNPAQDDALGGIALPSGEFEIDNAGTGNNTGDSLNWRRVTLAKFHIRAWRNGSTEPIMAYGTRGSSSNKSNIIHLERADAEGNMFLNYQLTNGTATRFSILGRTGAGGDDTAAHFQLGDVFELAVENHKTTFSAADSATPLQLVVTARVFRNGTLVDEIQFNDSAGMANIDHYDYGRVYVIGGNSAQTDISAVANVETWQSVTTIPAGEFLNHEQLLTASSHRPDANTKLGGFWSGEPVDTFNIPAKINTTKEFQVNGEKLDFTHVNALADYTFNVIIPTDSRIVNNCYVVQPEDHGQLIAIDPKATCIFVIAPLSLWTTDYNFKFAVTLDAAPNGLVRVAVPNFIGRPNSASNNGPSIVKQNTSASGLPTALRYPDNSASPVNYTGYDFLDLWHARDWVSINMVNNSGWCGLQIENLERFNAPQNPTNGQRLVAQTSTFSANLTSPTRTISVTKYKQVWENVS